jgi:hypothetical protein
VKSQVKKGPTTYEWNLCTIKFRITYPTRKEV